jgi:hypothetical protein
MSHDSRLSEALSRLRLCQTEIDRQLKEVCTRRSVAKLVKKRPRSLPQVSRPGALRISGDERPAAPVLAANVAFYKKTGFEHDTHTHSCHFVTEQNGPELRAGNRSNRLCFTIDSHTIRLQFRARAQDTSRRYIDPRAP